MKASQITLYCGAGFLGFFMVEIYSWTGLIGGIAILCLHQSLELSTKETIEQHSLKL